MKKLLTLSLVTILIFTLTGCSGAKLEEGQKRLELNADEEITLSRSVEDKDAEDRWDIDFDDKLSEIEDDIIDEWEDTNAEDYEILTLKKQDDYLFIEIFIDDADDYLWLDIDTTLEDLMESDWYDDFEEYQEDMEFVDYKSDDEIDEDELEDFEDYLVFVVTGGEEGSYYVVPGNIVLVSGDCDYEVINSKQIFIEDEESGYIVYED